VLTGKPDNIRRSADNLRDLGILGVKTEEQLMSVFKNAFKNGKVVSMTDSPYGVTIMKEINVGNKGSVEVGFFYKEMNLGSTPSITTLISKIHK